MKKRSTRIQEEVERGREMKRTREREVYMRQYIGWDLNILSIPY